MSDTKEMSNDELAQAIEQSSGNALAGFVVGSLIVVGAYVTGRTIARGIIYGNNLRKARNEYKEVSRPV